MSKDDHSPLDSYMGENKHRLLDPWEERALSETIQCSHETIIWHFCQIPFIVRRMQARHRQELFTQQGKKKSAVVKWLDAILMGYGDLKTSDQNQQVLHDLESFLGCWDALDQLVTKGADKNTLTEHRCHCLLLGKKLRLRRNALQGWVHDIQQLGEYQESVLEAEAGCSVACFHRHAHAILKAYRAYVEACDTLVLYNRRLVVSYAKEIKTHRDLLEVISDGNFGLYEATHKYEWRKGKFSTFATWWIKHRIKAGAGEKTDGIMVPIHIRKNLALVAKMTGQLEQKLARKPFPEEVAEAINRQIVESTPEDKKPKTISVRHVQELLEAARLSTISLDTGVDSEDESSDSLRNFIGDENAECPQEHTMRVLQSERIARVMVEYLTPVLHEIIRLRFWEGLSVTEVAKKLGMGREQVRQQEARAIHILSHPDVKRVLEAHWILGNE